MSITIDGQIFEIKNSDKNIVDLADRIGIALPAPCYRNNRKNGCCNSCVVEVDGKEQFACVTIPVNNMNININRDDLKEIRKTRLLEYQQALKDGKQLNSKCSCNCSKSSDCCK